MEYDGPLFGIKQAINVLILVVEYVKTNLFADDGVTSHQDHLLVAMSSTSGLYKTLGISLIPVFGLLVDRVEVALFMGWDSELTIRYVLINLSFTLLIEPLLLRLRECVTANWKLSE
jgi:hypothetical protein